MSPEQIASYLSLLLSAAALVAVLFWRKSPLTRQLHAEIEQQALEIKRLVVTNEEQAAVLKEARAKLATGSTLAEIAAKAVDYAATWPADERGRHALAAAQRLDSDDNGKRDYTDAQLSIAIRAVV